jgi:hypothetical protein
MRNRGKGYAYNSLGKGEVDSSILSGSTIHLDFSSPLAVGSIEVGKFAR